jgi:hypothetical protein
MGTDSRNILILGLLRQFGATVFDLTAFPGNTETGKGFMIVRYAPTGGARMQQPSLRRPLS